MIEDVADIAWRYFAPADFGTLLGFIHWAVSTLRNQNVERFNLFLRKYFHGKRNQLISVVIAGLVGDDPEDPLARSDVGKRLPNNCAQFFGRQGKSRRAAPYYSFQGHTIHL